MLWVKAHLAETPIGSQSTLTPGTFTYILFLSHLDLNEPPPTEVEEGRLDHVPFAQLGDASDVGLHLAMGGTI